MVTILSTIHSSLITQFCLNSSKNDSVPRWENFWCRINKSNNFSQFITMWHRVFSKTRLPLAKLFPNVIIFSESKYRFIFIYLLLLKGFLGSHFFCLWQGYKLCLFHKLNHHLSNIQNMIKHFFRHFGNWISFSKIINQRKQLLIYWKIGTHFSDYCFELI